MTAKRMDRVCPGCSLRSLRRSVYCRAECMAKHYKVRLRTAGNPTWMGGPPSRQCVGCGVAYYSHQPTTKYCTPDCRKSQTALITVACKECAKTFLSFPSAERIFCSYGCFLNSGGPFRAGLAASKAMLKYGPKKDANHNEIIAEMRKYCGVYDTSTAGHGVPDGVAWVANSWQLFDIKNPKTAYGRRGLNKVQKKWLEQWNGGPVYLIYTVEEAERFANGNFVGLKFEAPKERDAA